MGDNAYVLEGDSYDPKYRNLLTRCDARSYKIFNWNPTTNCRESWVHHETTGHLNRISSARLRVFASQCAAQITLIEAEMLDKVVLNDYDLSTIFYSFPFIDERTVKKRVNAYR